MKARWRSGTEDPRWWSDSPPSDSDDDPSPTGDDGDASADDGGCSTRNASRSAPSGMPVLLAAGLAALAMRRRQIGARG